jgi:hypothetical protein
MRPVLPGVPQGDGAFVRLAGEATFRKFALPLSPRGSGKTCSSVPLRGEIHEMNIGAIGLPKPGTRPVAAESVSGRARALFQNIENVMINPNRERDQQESGVESYQDPVLEDDEKLLELAVRMWEGGMLREIWLCDIVESLSLFCVVKKASPTELVLRLIMDNRKGNHSWRRPPWVPLCGPSAMSEVMILEEVGSFVYDTAAGDIPDWFYMLGIPYGISRYFGFPRISSARLKEALLARGSKVPPPDCSKGDSLALAVCAMGWSWAVYIAQAVLLDLLSSATGGEASKRLIIQGTPAAILQLAEGLEWVVWGYIDDFGLEGLLELGTDPGDGCVRKIYQQIKRYIISQGFGVHKETFGPVVVGLGIVLGAFGPSGSILARPDESKRQTLENATVWICSLKEVPVRWLATLVGCWTWWMLLNRPTLSIFRFVYTMTTGLDMSDVVPVTPEIIREFWAAVHLSVLMWSDLTLPFLKKMFMSDASPSGGALCESEASLEELALEAKWAGRGGFFTVRDTDILALETIEDWTRLTTTMFDEEENEEEEQMMERPLGTDRHLEFRFLLLCGGPPHHGGLGWWLQELGSRIGVSVAIEYADLQGSPSVDLLDPLTRGNILEKARSGWYSGVHDASPSGTWSRALWSGELGLAPRGPRPYRSRKEPWGLSKLTVEQKKRVRRANGIIHLGLDLIREMISHGRPWTKMHPEDPGEDPFPSLWVTEEWESLVASDPRSSLTSFDACRFGSESQSPLSIGGSFADWGCLRNRCNHVSGHRPRIGRDQYGIHRTRAFRLPSLAARELARLILRELLQNPDSGVVRAPFLVSDPGKAAGGIPTAEPGVRLRAPSIGEGWDNVGRWKEAYRFNWLVPGEAPNIIESRTVVGAVRHVGRSSSSWDKRILLATDNLSALGCLSKGRSNRAPLRQICRSAAAFVLAYGLRLLLRWVESRRNHADGPSRQKSIGYFAG